MIEAPTQLSLSVLKKIRSDFGPGVAGKSAFRIIAKGAICEGTKDRGEKCNKKAEKTIDFDAPRVNVLVQIPTCTDCLPQIKDTVSKECIAQGSTPSFGINGMGRT